MDVNNIPIALTYDDVLIVPQRSSMRSRSEADTSTWLTKQISLSAPIISSNMDTVTESEMAISMARLGGIGILHRFMTIEENAEEVKRVKRAQNFVIYEPYTIDPNKTVSIAKQVMANNGVTGLLVSNGDGRLLGVLSKRDILFAEDDGLLVRDVMTPRDRLVVGDASTNLNEAKRLLAQHRVEKLPLVDMNNSIVGLITSCDIKNLIDYPYANVDKKGRLIVGGSIGVHGDYLERASALINVGVDVLVVDIAHGHSELMFSAVRKLREQFGDVQIIAGNTASAKGARELCEAGVDGIKVGVGPGTICITRLVAGCGVPQFTAVAECARVAKEYGVPVIADGGIQKSGDIVKALGAGADTVMLGGMLAGTKESPGVVMSRAGKKFKVCRGSASFAVAQRRKKVNQESKKLGDVVPEGVEAVVPFKGPVGDIIGQLVGGLRSGMSYTNSRTVGELQNNAEFVRVTNAGLRESGAHDLIDVK
ncbi:MAG: IMP dehydrogenase [Candidatus Magasanikbacteria bacterium]|nr:IMP dehydrogenase [Candidatus Magasanikbacteria bacterium]